MDIDEQLRAEAGDFPQKWRFCWANHLQVVAMFDTGGSTVKNLVEVGPQVPAFSFGSCFAATLFFHDQPP